MYYIQCKLVLRHASVYYQILETECVIFSINGATELKQFWCDIMQSFCMEGYSFHGSN
jgi:hypothetical protein